MELDCLKFNEKISSDEAACRHPDDYCKYRTSCMICFLEKENKLSGVSRTNENKSQKDNSLKNG